MAKEEGSTGFPSKESGKNGSQQLRVFQPLSASDLKRTLGRSEVVDSGECTVEALSLLGTDAPRKQSFRESREQGAEAQPVFPRKKAPTARQAFPTAVSSG